MNIDFHYGYMYIVARLGGLGQADAATMSHACQYIDDSTTNGILKFSQGQSFERFAAAHEIFDYSANADQGQDKVVWTPFHFLPGGHGQTIEDMAVCKKDSLIAQRMIEHTLKQCHDKADDPGEINNALHRLGVALHAYVDTWAHHEFSGFPSRRNDVSHLESDDFDHDAWWQRLKDALASSGVGIFSRLGHGAALHFPDWPWARWHYVDGNGKTVHRDNLPEFVEAANSACKVVQAFVHGSSQPSGQSGLTEDAKAVLRQLMETNRDENEAERLDVVMRSVAAGHIPGLPAEQMPSYVAKGHGSWKHIATGIDQVDDGGTLPSWSPAFEASDYRKFHDAVKEHRFYVIGTLLPRHGIRLV